MLRRFSTLKLLVYPRLARKFRAFKGNARTNRCDFHRKYLRILQTRDLANEYSFQEDDGTLPPDMRWRHFLPCVLWIAFAFDHLLICICLLCECIWSFFATDRWTTCLHTLASVGSATLFHRSSGFHCIWSNYTIFFFSSVSLSTSWCVTSICSSIYLFFRIPMWVMHFGSYKF